MNMGEGGGGNEHGGKGGGGGGGQVHNWSWFGRVGVTT